MADFIIQPKDNDHLKLNNDAGTTILEFANDESKLRLAQNNISASDGTTAITTSGANVTLAGTANNIGTATGTFNGSLSGATFPTTVTDRTDFYHSVKATQSGTTFAPENYGQYAVAGNTENNYAVCSGIAPTGFTDIVDMYWWFITTNGGTQTYQAEFAWSIAGDGQNYEVHVRGDTSFFSGASYAQNTMVRKSLMSNGSPTFESTIAAGDAFGLRVKHNINLSIVTLGASITWRF